MAEQNDVTITSETEASNLRNEATLTAMGNESYDNLNRMMTTAASRRRINMMHMEPTR